MAFNLFQKSCQREMLYARLGLRNVFAEVFAVYAAMRSMSSGFLPLRHAPNALSLDPACADRRMIVAGRDVVRVAQASMELTIPLPSWKNELHVFYGDGTLCRGNGRLIDFLYLSLAISTHSATTIGNPRGIDPFACQQKVPKMKYMKSIKSMMGNGI